MADFRRGKRQRKSWDSFGQTQILMTANGTFAQGTTQTVVPGDAPFTVLRLIGEYVIGPSHRGGHRQGV